MGEREEAARKEAEAAEAAAAKKKSWFFGGGAASKPENNGQEQLEANREGDINGKENFLGKVTIEFGQLLTRGCIAGDFPIATNGKPLGGTLSLCLRTIPVSLDPDRYEGVPQSPSRSPSIVRYKNGLDISFTCDEEDEDNEDKDNNVD